MLSTVVEFFENYGWFIFGFGVVVAFSLKKLQPRITAWRKKVEDDEYAAKYHKNPDLIAARLAAQEAHRRKMQEEHDRAAEVNRLKMEEKEKKKREEFLEKQSGSGSGSKLGFKSDYNPLMGDTSRGYRATKKSPCGGGGCGK